MIHPVQLRIRSCASVPAAVMLVRILRYPYHYFCSGFLAARIRRNRVTAVSFVFCLLATQLFSQPSFLPISLRNGGPYSIPVSIHHSSDPPKPPVGQVSAATVIATLGGYASKVSVKPGESIDFHLSTNWPTPYNLTIWREGVSRTLMTTLTNVVPRYYDCTNGYSTGCNWPVAHQFIVPVDWPSGVYTADIPTVTAGVRHLIFYVRAAEAGLTSKILVLGSVNTWQAYNEYGGKSLYDYNSSNGVRSPRVSFNRPHTDWTSGLGDFPRWEAHFNQWMEQEGYQPDYATDYDLESIPTLLTGYDVIISVGHSEYWTWNARQRLQQFITNGGRYINFSGNTMWWQVRFEENGRTMVGYKDYQTDPVKSAELTTINPQDYPIFDAPYPLIGGYWSQGGYPFSPNLSFEHGYGGYQVQQAGHWVFANTGATNQQMIGRTLAKTTAILDHEVDGSSFNCGVDGYTVLSPLANTGVAENFTILGVAPAYVWYLGFSVMGIYTNENGGAVFSTNTTGWANALGVDPQINQITRNVLDRFLDHETPLPQEQTASDTRLLFYDRFNCSKLAAQWPTPAASEWQSLPAHNYVAATDRTAFQYDENCGVSGAGLKMPVGVLNNRTLSVMVKPNWGSTTELYSSLYVDLSQLTLAEGDTIDLLRMGYDTRNNGGALVASLQITHANGNYYMGHTAVNNQRLLVPKDRPFLVKTVWDETKNWASLWVNGSHEDQAIVSDSNLMNSASNPPVNRVELGLTDLGAGAAGFLCVDEFILDDKPVHTQYLDVLALDVHTIGQGSVTRSREKPLYSDGEELTLIAVPASGWALVQWDGFQTANTLTTTLTIEENMVVTATFAPLLSLTATVVGQGEILGLPATGYLPPGETVTLTAQPTEGWRFIEWRGDVYSTTPTITVTMDSSKTIEAVFEHLPALTITVVGNGTVTRTPDKSFYALGEQVTLMAQAADGWRFAAWSGAVSNTQSPITITITPNQTVVATFEAAGETTYTLQVNTTGNGTVLRSPEQATYSPGQQVELTAQPAEGWRFVEWRGDVYSTTPTITVTMDGSKTIEAAFEQLHPLAITVVGNGVVTRTLDKAFYALGEQVTLTAQAADGWRFAAWSGAVSDTHPSITLTIAPNLSVVATFEAVYALQVEIVGRGNVSRSPAQETYSPDQQVTLTAQPVEGWHFSHWSGNVAPADVKSPVLTVTMKANLQVIANFATDKAKEIYLPLIAR